MKKINIIALLISGLFVFQSCGDEYFDINNNPNSAVDENMSAELILPSALDRVASMTATGAPDYARWLGYYARSGTYGPNTDEENYALTSSYNRGEWLTWYDILKDWDVLEQKAKAKNQTGYLAIAKIMKTIGFMSLVDQYNNIPYSKAFDYKDNLLTPYDKAEDVYKDLLKQLEEADALLKDAKADQNYEIEAADIVFNGDFNKWRKLANTQRLRLLMHQTKILSASQLQAEVAKITANGAGFLMAGETAEVQPGYVKDQGKQNPYWNAYKADYAGKVADNFNRANNYFLNLLKGNSDVRYKYFYSEAEKPTNGEVYYGFTYGNPASGQKGAANSSNVAGPGIAKSPEMAQWFLPSFESMFLQAEAMQRGILAGDAKAMYEAAVKESFVWLGVEDADTVVDEYLHSALSTFANWDSNSDKLELILTQKYIAMFGINSVESWTDYRRTGVPNVPLSVSPGRGTNVIPKRLIYPLEEYQYNKENALAQGTINPQVDKIFWDK